MALPDVFRVQTGTLKTFKNSGGDAACTMANISTGAAVNSDKLDLGATRAAVYDVFADIEFSSNPTDATSVDFYWAPSSSGTAATDNPGAVDGTDGAYSGLVSVAGGIRQLQYMGSLSLAASSTVQKAWCGRFSPAQRYGTLVVVNNAGVATTNTNTNHQVRIVPLEGVVEDT